MELNCANTVANCTDEPVEPCSILVSFTKITVIKLRECFKVDSHNRHLDTVISSVVWVY